MLVKNKHTYKHRQSVRQFKLQLEMQLFRNLLKWGTSESEMFSEYKRQAKESTWAICNWDI